MMRLECGACLRDWDEAHTAYAEERRDAGTKWREGIRWQVCQTNKPLPIEVVTMREHQEEGQRT